jgi:hypothetical protein
MEEAFWGEHPGTLASMDAMSLVYLALDRLDEAEATLALVVEKRTRAMGAEHPLMLVSMGHLVRV